MATKKTKIALLVVGALAVLGIFAIVMASTMRCDVPASAGEAPQTAASEAQSGGCSLLSAFL